MFDSRFNEVHERLGEDASMWFGIVEWWMWLTGMQ